MNAVTSPRATVAAFAPAWLAVVYVLLSAGNQAALGDWAWITIRAMPTAGALLLVGLLVATVIVVGALTFFPALSLGPIVEHFLMHEGRLFSTMLVSFPVWS